MHEDWRAIADLKSNSFIVSSVVETSRHSTSTEDKSQQCKTSFAFHHRHKSVTARFLFILQAPQWPCAIRKQLSRDRCFRGRSKPGCRIVGSSTREKLTTWADFRFPFHRLLWELIKPHTANRPVTTADSQSFCYRLCHISVTSGQSNLVMAISNALSLPLCSPHPLS